jgi:hypothetical protein
MILAAGLQTDLSISAIEGVLTLLAIGIAFCIPRKSLQWVSRIEALLRRLSRRKALSVVAVGAAAMLLRLAILPLCPIPQEFIPDGFSFLLAGDTFAAGRLANPTPAMWQHFETVHVSMMPTYMSMYFPAQGLILAAGKVLFGQPWLGLLCVNALMCAALCWMLQAWLPPGWALLGGALAVLRLSLFSYWINTYAGGAAIAALGGALVLGAFPRIMRTHRPMRLRDGMLLAAGLVTFELSRPYEGLMLSIPVALALSHWAFLSDKRPARYLLLRRAALPLLLVVAGSAWLAYYDYRAFGSAMTLPYTLNRAQYAVEPYWIWQSPRPEPVYRHAVMRAFYVLQELPIVTSFRTPSGFIIQNLLKPIHILQFFAGIALLPPLIMLPRVLRDRRMRFFALSAIPWTAAIFIQIVLLPHYLAPYTAAFYLIGLQCMRHLRTTSMGRMPVGLWMVRLLVAVCVVMAGIRAFAAPFHLSLADDSPSAWTANWYGPSQLGSPRARIASQLAQMPGQQLAIVRYSPGHDPVREWVYNSADIDRSNVIWAREMSPAEDLKLIRYYNNRKVWLVQPDTQPVSVTPYPMTPSVVTSSHRETVSRLTPASQGSTRKWYVR